ncbi:unnamed protein product, partial [Symbiodinium sp. CCMP2592]
YHANPLPQLHFGNFQILGVLLVAGKTGEELPNVAGDLIDIGSDNPTTVAAPISFQQALSRAMRTEPVPRTGVCH